MIFAGKTTASKDRISTNALRDQNRNKCEVFLQKYQQRRFQNEMRTRRMVAANAAATACLTSLTNPGAENGFRQMRSIRRQLFNSVHLLWHKSSNVAAIHITGSYLCIIRRGDRYNRTVFNKGRYVGQVGCSFVLCTRLSIWLLLVSLQVAVEVVGSSR